jgi:uncharacterized membrane protein
MRTLVVTGLCLSVIGAVLDFLSGYELIQPSNDMSMVGERQLLIGAGLIALGVIVIVSGVVFVGPWIAPRMNLMGALMEVYGIAMGLVSTYVPSMNPQLADAMLVVGILMFLNGILMQSRMKTKSM